MMSMMTPKQLADRRAGREQTVQTEQAPLDPVLAATARQQTLLGQAGGFLGLPAATVFNVLRGIWTTSKGQEPLTDQEMRQGVALIARYELDPFAREIYVTRDNKGNPMVIIGIDGWIKILDRTDHYDGMEQELLWKGEKTDPVNCYAVITRVYSTKRSKPAVYLAYRLEYAVVAGFMNSKIPLHMLRIFSIRHAARLFVPLGGCITEEEARGMMDPADQPVPATTLDDLTEKMTPADYLKEQAAMLAEDVPVRFGKTTKILPPDAPPLPAIPKPPPPPLPNPPTSEEVKADQAQLAEEFAGEFARVTTVKDVAAVRNGVALSVGGGTLTHTQGAELNELAKAAEERIGKK